MFARTAFVMAAAWAFVARTAMRAAAQGVQRVERPLLIRTQHRIETFDGVGATLESRLVFGGAPGHGGGHAVEAFGGGQRRFVAGPVFRPIAALVRLGLHIGQEGLQGAFLIWSKIQHVVQKAGPALLMGLPPLGVIGPMVHAGAGRRRLLGEGVG